MTGTAKQAAPELHQGSGCIPTSRGFILVGANLPNLAMALMKVGFRPIMLPDDFSLDPKTPIYFITLAGRVLVTDRPGEFKSAMLSCGLGILEVGPAGRPSHRWAQAISRTWEAIQPRISQGFHVAVRLKGRAQLRGLG